MKHLWLHKLSNWVSHTQQQDADSLNSVSCVGVEAHLQDSSCKPKIKTPNCLVGCIVGREKMGGEPGKGKSGGPFQNSVSDQTEGFLFQMYTNRNLFLIVQLYCKLSLLTEKCYVVTFLGKDI